MLFNSVEFAIFLPIVFIVYWLFLKNSTKSQNIWLLLASYFFYGWWDWRFLFLILFSSLLDYVIGLKLTKSSQPRQRRILLATSVITNIGFLGFFKYFNFFLQSFVDAFTFFGYTPEIDRLNIILPVGISFYTFQTLSYTIDIYKGKLNPTRDFVAFFAFVSFFPQLVAGPIERAADLLPQFFNKRFFMYENISQGVKMVTWGLFMKVVVADRLALYVNNVYADVSDQSGVSLSVATLFFAFQIYSDFAGYSLIARGCGKLLGFNLVVNFRRPYFATSFKSFWSRWHISLSTWFRDYVYIPLGGSRTSTVRSGFNLFLTFFISGFWHGANWTFLAWGALHGFYQIIEKYTFRVEIPKFIRLLLVFLLTNLAWVFFRAPTITEAIEIISKIVFLEGGGFYFGDKGIFLYALMAISILFISDLIVEFKPQWRLLYHPNLYIRFSSFILIVIYIVSFGVFDESQFIYFQF